MSQSQAAGLAPVAGARGVLVSVSSSVLFGLIYFLTPLLHPMSGEAVWAIRALVTLPFITLLLVMSRGWRSAAEVATRVRRRPIIALGIIASAALLSLQLWLFSWAPLNGRGMQVALGYFLLPLVLVLVGRLLYKDRMTWWQWLAAGVALIGVVYEVIRIGGISLETLAVALGYPIYFVLRRTLGTGHLGGMWWEFVCMVPLAMVVLVWSFADGAWLRENPELWWWAPAISLLAAGALFLYMLASRLLSMSLFGLLSYVEPAMLVVAAVLIGERIAGDEWFTYGAIWLAVLVLIVGGASQLVLTGGAGRTGRAGRA